MLSKTCKYGLRGVIYLAVHSKENKLVGIKKISEDLEIPTPFLGKILQTLARHKILISTKGPNGGFGLAKNASEIRLIDIVLLLDGDDLFENCLISLKKCSERGKECTLHKEYSIIRKKIKELFTNKTIADLVDNYENEEQVYL